MFLLNAKCERVCYRAFYIYATFNKRLPIRACQNQSKITFTRGILNSHKKYTESPFSAHHTHVKLNLKITFTRGILNSHKKYTESPFRDAISNI
ncbi:hypothetical protein OrNV_gp101 [Oryctes rhinoceros nudivirus]|uniref:Uncharacterized protein n=1 Tax=Oryctes rhinoceros nudivirus TaxID=92521 RepID=A0A7D3UIW0_9VIRU|nr:hypothetical protein OrNV_gp101 [Oryctes rhinoceros nudivirus]ACH96231.1 unknown [Oryctes rhinoceros nudivirus]QKE59564.1 hypothetical protein SI_OrNV_gp101 [Oryctes rhinoceros nudivirus]UBO76511.1 hypothetical protein SI_OrNV_gp101 [Oryctes rhinoceros nudivirus]UBR58278.1 hypothetical protein [Oryctes rhinoceros nudivirus]UBR58408.1 hypothetical protein [Oryctes rhinoceros nudivirus]